MAGVWGIVDQTQGEFQRAFSRGEVTTSNSLELSESWAPLSMGTSSRAGVGDGRARTQRQM